MAMDWTNPQEVSKRRMQAIKAGYKPADVDKFISQKQAEAAQMQIAQQGQLPESTFQDLTKNNPQAALQVLKGGYSPKVEPAKPKEPSDTEKTNRIKAKSALDALSRLEQELKDDPNVRMKAAVPGHLLGANGYSSDYASLIDLLGNLRTGATITPQQQKLYEDLLPRVSDSNQDITKKLNDRRAEFQAYLPQEATPPAAPQAPQTPPGPQEGLAMQTARDRSNDPGNWLQAMGDWWNKSRTPMPELYIKGKDGKKTLNPEFVNYGQNLALAGGGGGESAKVTAQGAAKIPKFLQSLVSLKSIGNKRDLAVQASKDLKFSGDDIAKAAKDYVENDPMAKNVLNKILPTLEGKQIDLPTLMKKIEVWNDAYTSAGKVGKSAEAGINDVLAKFAKTLLKEKAPDVAKANKQFQRAYGARSVAKKAIPAAAAGVGFSVGGDVLSQWLFGGK